MKITNEEMQMLLNTLICDSREIMSAAALPKSEPGLYRAWKDTRSPTRPIEQDPAVYIEMLAVRIKDAIAVTTRELTTGKVKPECEEAAAYDVWLQTFADVVYIANILNSEHPILNEALKPLRDEPLLVELLVDLAGYLNERASLIWAHPDAPEICDAQKEKRGLKTSHDTEH